MINRVLIWLLVLFYLFCGIMPIIILIHYIWYILKEDPSLAFSVRWVWDKYWWMTLVYGLLMIVHFTVIGLKWNGKF